MIEKLMEKLSATLDKVGSAASAAEAFYKNQTCYEKTTLSPSNLGGAAALPAKDKKATTKKTEPVAPAAAVALVGIEGRKQLAALTDKETETEVYEYAKAVIQRFPDPAGPGPDGTPAPEGWHKVKATGKEFGIEKVADLKTADQRKQFMARLAQLLLKPEAAAEKKEDLAGIGV